MPRPSSNTQVNPEPPLVSLVLPYSGISGKGSRSLRDRLTPPGHTLSPCFHDAAQCARCIPDSTLTNFHLGRRYLPTPDGIVDSELRPSAAGISALSISQYRPSSDSGSLPNDCHYARLEPKIARRRLFACRLYTLSTPHCPPRSHCSSFITLRYAVPLSRTFSPALTHLF